MIMNDALISHFEATNDIRILPMMTKYFKYCYNLPDELFLPPISWDYFEKKEKMLETGNREYK
jgi:hypothetical protein